MITAQGDKVIVRVAHRPQMSDGGLFLPDLTSSEGLKVGRSRTATQEAVVISIGHSVTIPLNTGDRVFYDKFAGTTIHTEEEGDLLVLAPTDLLARLDSKE